MNMQDHRGNQTDRWLIAKKPLLLLATAGLVLTGCATYQEPTVEEPVADPQLEQSETLNEQNDMAEATNVQLGELTGNVEDYLGQTVSVRGEGEYAIGDTAFLLQDDQLFGGQEVVVFNATGQPFVLPQEDITEEVQVTGEVREMVLADIEQDYGIDLNPQDFTEYEGQTVIVADSLAFSPDPEEVTENPTAFYDRTIAVSGEVGERLSNNTFTLQDEGLFGGEEVLVIGTSPEIALTDNEDIVVTGTLRPYVAAEFEQDYDLTWDLDLQRQIEAEYSEEPVLVAEEVFPSAE